MWLNLNCIIDINVYTLHKIIVQLHFVVEGGGNQGIPYKIQELQEQEWGS